MWHLKMEEERPGYCSLPFRNGLFFGKINMGLRGSVINDWAKANDADNLLMASS